MGDTRNVFRVSRSARTYLFAGTSHAGGGTRAPDTRIMIPRRFGSTAPVSRPGGQESGRIRTRFRPRTAVKEASVCSERERLAQRLQPPCRRWSPTQAERLRRKRQVTSSVPMGRLPPWALAASRPRRLYSPRPGPSADSRARARCARCSARALTASRCSPTARCHCGITQRRAAIRPSRKKSIPSSPS